MFAEREVVGDRDGRGRALLAAELVAVRARRGRVVDDRRLRRRPRWGSPAGSVIVTEAALVKVSALAQWISRRIWSKATRALSWAWKRRLASSSAFAPETKSVRQRRDDDHEDRQDREQLDERVAARAAERPDHARSHVSPSGSRPRRAAAGDPLALGAEAESDVQAAVDLNEGVERVVAVLPAEAGAGDDPGVLVEPVLDEPLARACELSAATRRWSSFARCGSGISSAGSPGAPGTTKSGLR